MHEFTLSHELQLIRESVHSEVGRSPGGGLMEGERRWWRNGWLRKAAQRRFPAARTCEVYVNLCIVNEEQKE